MSYKDLDVSVQWTPYGDASMEEPPSEEFAHILCWQDIEDWRVKLIESIAWAKPYINKGELNERTEISKNRHTFRKKRRL